MPPQLHRSAPLARALLLHRPPPGTRTLIAAPKPDSGPLLRRRADRALPSAHPPRGFVRTLPLFALLLAGGTAAIFNYQKQASSVTAATLYALRTSPEAALALGDEIYFARLVPWVSGELNPLRGRVDIGFWVKGTRGTGWMRFRSERRGRRGFFETLEWSLTMEDGRVVQLYKPEGPDPFRRIVAGEDEEKYTH